MTGLGGAANTIGILIFTDYVNLCWNGPGILGLVWGCGKGEEYRTD